MFAFSQIDPETQGTVEDMRVPFTDFAAASAEQGWHDSLGSTLYRWQEQRLEENDPSNERLTPEEANKRFGMEGLTFDDPTNEGVARLLQQRHQEQANRNFLLSQGDDSLARTLAGAGVSMASSMLNPLDFAMMFVPVVGEEKAGAILGIRSALRKGLVSPEDLVSAFPRAPKLAESVIQGASYQAIAELPRQIMERKELEPVTDPLLDIAQGALMAGAFHLAAASAFHLLGKMRPETLKAMDARALDDFAGGRDIDVRGEAALDPSVYEQEAFNREINLQQDAEGKYAAMQHEAAGPPVEEAAIPETPPEEERKYSSVYDEIRQNNADTTKKIQSLFPKMELSNEEAAALRRKAWDETPAVAGGGPAAENSDAAYDRIQDAIEQARQDAEQKKKTNETARQAKERERRMAQQPPMAKPVVEENTHDAVNPDAAAVEQRKAKAKAKKAAYDKARRQRMKLEEQKKSGFPSLDTSINPLDEASNAEGSQADKDEAFLKAAERGGVSRAKMEKLQDKLIDDRIDNLGDAKYRPALMNKESKNIFTEGEPDELGVVHHDAIEEAMPQHDKENSTRGYVDREGKFMTLLEVAREEMKEERVKETIPTGNAKFNDILNKEEESAMQSSMESGALPKKYKPAIKGKSGKIFTGKGLGEEYLNKDHNDIITSLPKEEKLLGGYSRGFIDRKGKFMTLLEVARAQMKEKEPEVDPLKLKEFYLSQGFDENGYQIKKKTPLNPGGSLESLPKELQDQSNSVKEAMRAEFEKLKAQAKEKESLNISESELEDFEQKLVEDRRDGGRDAKYVAAVKNKKTGEIFNEPYGRTEEEKYWPVQHSEIIEGMSTDQRLGGIERGFMTKEGKFMSLIEVAREEMKKGGMAEGPSPITKTIESAADCIIRKIV